MHKAIIFIVSLLLFAKTLSGLDTEAKSRNLVANEAEDPVFDSIAEEHQEIADLLARLKDVKCLLS